MKDKIGYILLGVIIVAYAVCCFLGDIEYISKITTTLTAVIGALAIWWQLKRQRDLTEAEFIMNYNTAFIANAELTRIEKALEEYRTTI
ncbi:MAG: hypothetical protein QMB62_09440, partial [Oscillospiraceae bacterium]